MLNETYDAEIEAWRQSMEAQLRAEDGWLALIGLEWLVEGESTIGSAADCTIVLPEGVAPAIAALILRSGDQVLIRPQAGAAVLINGEPADERELRSDRDGSPDLVQIGRVSFTLIERNGRFGVRLRDPQNPDRLNFTGRRWFPIDERYRVAARFEAHAEPYLIGYQDMLGEEREDMSIGRLHFEIDGEPQTLEAVRDQDLLRVVFRDATAGIETYGAARFVKFSPPSDGIADLDFNRAYNPPCAFSSYTTCPLPPRENILKVRIPAGERLSS